MFGREERHDRKGCREGRRGSVSVSVARWVEEGRSQVGLYVKLKSKEGIKTECATLLLDNSRGPSLSIQKKSNNDVALRQSRYSLRI